MSKMDLESQYIRAMQRGLIEDMRLIDTEGKCADCQEYDEIIDGEEWSCLDEKTGLCESCYKHMVKSVELNCPYCRHGCVDCLL